MKPFRHSPEATLMKNRRSKSWLIAIAGLLSLPSIPALAVHYTYDNNNQIVSVSYDGNQQAVYGYDENGNITSIALRGVVQKSSFYGLIAATPPDPEESGSVVIKLTDKRIFTATFTIDGKRYSLKGEFNPTGEYTGQLVRGGTLSTLDVFLTLDYLAGADSITGRFEEGGVTIAVISADHGSFDPKKKPAADAGRYTVSISSDPTQPLPAQYPQGYSFGTLTVSATGAIKFAGVLADGTKVTQGTWVSQNRTWPLYLAPYKTGGLLMGKINFQNTADVSDLDGTITWTRDPGGKAPYAVGFSGTAGLIGSRYEKPGKGETALHVTTDSPNLQAQFGSGDLIGTQTKSFTLLATNKVLAPVPQEFSLSITTASGLFKGSFLPTGETTLRKFQGVLFQKQNLGIGWFPGGDVTGYVEISEP